MALGQLGTNTPTIQSVCPFIWLGYHLEKRSRLAGPNSNCAHLYSKETEVFGSIVVQPIDCRAVIIPNIFGNPYCCRATPMP